MNAAELAVKKKTFFLFLALILGVSGVVSYFRMGKLEDPEFTIKTAVVITPYPGASTLEVEEQISNKIEEAVMKMDRLNYVQTQSKQGMSIAHVYLQPGTDPDEVPQHWDRLRRRISDIQADLPQEAGPSEVIDDFGDVYGIIVALTGEDYSYPELKEYADLIQKELFHVDQVSRVEIWGERTECIYVDISRARLAGMGISPGRIAELLEDRSGVVQPGAFETEQERIRFHLTGGFSDVRDVREMVVGVNHQDTDREELIYLQDVARVEQGLYEPPVHMMRFNGRQALGIAVSTVSGGNVIETGQGVKAKLSELSPRLPVGLQTHFLAYEPDMVEDAIHSFMINLLQAVAIVSALLLVFMGIRSGLIIGSGLVLTILATFVFMRYLGMELDRVSLGALIIALGMLVDNSIVVTEGIMVKIQTGTSKMAAAARTVRETAWPLLGATLVAVFAFMPVVMAGDDTGEYTRGLFIVIAVSLLVSWFLAMSVTPLWCHMFLGKDSARQSKDPYAARMYQVYRKLLDWSLRHRTLVLAGIAAIFIVSAAGFGLVQESFFPPSTRPQLKIDYWLPEGSRIEQVSRDMQRIEQHLLEHEHVVSVGSFIGEGAPRFYLPMEPRLPNSSYGQMVVNLDRASSLNEVLNFARDFLRADFAHARPRVRKFSMGPPVEFPVEVRFSGQDREVLQDLAAKAEKIFRADPDSIEVRNDWRQQVKTYELNYDEARGIRWGASRQDAARALKTHYDGQTIGVVRQKDNLLPVILRVPESSRNRPEDIYSVEVQGPYAKQGVPLGQIISDAGQKWEDSVIIRRDRIRTITVQSSVASGRVMEMRERIRPVVEAIKLPPGYRMEWGGEYEQSRDSQAEVFSGVPLSFMLMLLVVVGLFKTLKQPLIILLVVPLSLTGVSAGLLLTGQPFGFMALLGALSLSGMLIKNMVVLIDQMDLNLERGKDRYEAVLDASVSRLRPVMMATLSTVMGMTPLILDIFWLSMAIVIVCGLTFATVLTLVVAPVLYSLFFRIRPGN